MAARKTYQALIQILEKLYFRITSRIIDKRSHPTIKNNQLVASDIKKPLADKIDAISRTHIVSASTAVKKPPLKKAARRNKPTSPSSTVHTSAVLTRTLNGIARRFNSKTLASKLNPLLSEQLKKSTWEHIHSAIRYAHQGNEASAKINADIANNALREIAHYMTEEQYRNLYNEIKQELTHLDS